MKKAEYIKVQIETSEWTRQNINSMALTRDSVNEFAKYVDKKSRILEIGCGDGYSLSILKKAGYDFVAGCDINHEKLRVAVSYGETVSVQDAHELGYPDNTFEAIFDRRTEIIRNELNSLIFREES